MDCQQACELISAAHDGEPVDAALLAEARTHEQTCAECAAFARVLDRMASAPAPEAPSELIERIGAIAGQTPADTRRERGRLLWLPRILPLASAAAVLLVVASIGGVALLDRAGQVPQDAVLTESARDGSLTKAPTAGMAEDAASTFAGASATAPDYVMSSDRAVWALTGVTDTAPANPTSAGNVRSAFDGSMASERAAYHPGDDRSVLYVADDRGGYRVFTRPVRNLGGARYGLMSDTNVDSFGTWPTLPGPQPDAADGSPVFVQAGYDDLGVEVFTVPGASTTDGFAVAPGTAPDDPAAGNPGWTWWEPLP